MTPTHVPEQFDGTMGCTATELSSGLLRIPQLQVHFAFQGMDDKTRYGQQKFFDLPSHRGGG